MATTAIRPIIYTDGGVKVAPHIMLAYRGIRARLDAFEGNESPRIAINKINVDHTVAGYPKTTGPYHLPHYLWSFTAVLFDSPLGTAEDRVLAIQEIFELWSYDRSRTNANITLDDYVTWYTEFKPTSGSQIRRDAPWTTSVKTTKSMTGGDLLGYYARFFVHFNSPPVFADYVGKATVQLSLTETLQSCSDTTTYSYP